MEREVKKEQVRVGRESGRKDRERERERERESGIKTERE